MKLIVVFFICLLACNPQENEDVVVHGYVFKDSPIHFMRRHYKLRIWYEYIYNDIKYEGVKTISKGETRYFDGDSVFVQLNKLNPVESTIVGKIEKPKKDVKFVSKSKKSNGIKAYSVVDKKPIFSYNGISGEDAINQYFSSEIKDIGVREKGIVGVNIVIDETGQVQSQKIARSANAFLDTVAVEIVKNMPTWEPAEYKGEKVKVAYLAEIKFNTD